MAGLVLIPLGAAASLIGLNPAGVLVVAAGFGLGLSFLVSPLVDHFARTDRAVSIAPAILPTFIGATLAAAAARASEDWVAAASIGYLALVWIYFRMQPDPPARTRY